MFVRGKIGHRSFVRQVSRWMANTQQWLFDLNSLTTGEADVSESLTVTGDRLYSTAGTSTTVEASWNRRWPYREFDSRWHFLLLFSLVLSSYFPYFSPCLFFFGATFRRFLPVPLHFYFMILFLSQRFSMYRVKSVFSILLGVFLSWLFSFPFVYSRYRG